MVSHFARLRSKAAGHIRERQGGHARGRLELERGLFWSANLCPLHPFRTVGSLAWAASLSSVFPTPIDIGLRLAVVT